MANRKHPWNKIDPLLLERKISMAEIARKFGIPYRQVTNRYYAVRNKLAAQNKSKEVKKVARNT
jgi:DNA-binding CsgD family transcriptional regulator